MAETWQDPVLPALILSGLYADPSSPTTNEGFYAIFMAQNNNPAFEWILGDVSEKIAAALITTTGLVVATPINPLGGFTTFGKADLLAQGDQIVLKPGNVQDYAFHFGDISPEYDGQTLTVVVASSTLLQLATVGTVVTLDTSQLLSTRVTFGSSVGLSPLEITTGSLPAGVLGQVYVATLTATGGRAPYSFSTVGGIPNGMKVSQTGVIDGIPTQAGTFDFGITVMDSAGNQVVKYFNLVVTKTASSAPTSGPTPKNPPPVGSTQSSGTSGTAGSPTFWGRLSTTDKVIGGVAIAAVAGGIVAALTSGGGD